jgi:hypothetical protein
MSAIYPMSFHHRIARHWAERLKSLRQIHAQIVVATEQTLRIVLNSDGPLIPIPVRAIIDQRRLDESRRRD